MKCRDLHEAPKTEILKNCSGRGFEFNLVKLQWSKQEIAYSLHITSTSFLISTSFSDNHILDALGFSQFQCNYSLHKNCMAVEVSEDFKLDEFKDDFEKGIVKFREAERKLNECGYFFGRLNEWQDSGGDGHTATKSEIMKNSEDDHFHYKMSWLESNSDKGWVFHYLPKNQPFSIEMELTLKFLGLEKNEGCPFVDFEPCYWKFYQFIDDGHRTVQYVHDCFAKQSQSFSKGIEFLLDANRYFSKFGFSLLPQVPESTIVPANSQADDPNSSSKKIDLLNHKFDVAVSFAGSDRAIVEKFSKLVRDAGYSVFYDNFYIDQLWGKDLPVFFHHIYGKNSKYCVIFCSDDYLKRIWTNQERQFAVARFMSRIGEEYILPIMIDDTELLGLPQTIGNVSLKQKSIEEIADLLIKKLKG